MFVLFFFVSILKFIYFSLFFGWGEGGGCSHKSKSGFLMQEDPTQELEGYEAGTGELMTRGPHVMRGYWSDEAATAAVLSQNGWLRTGDLGRKDKSGNYWLLGRLKDVIRSGGENVSAPEVERILIKHPSIAAAAVVGLPHPRFGEQVAACVVLREGTLWRGPCIGDAGEAGSLGSASALPEPSRHLTTGVPENRGSSGRVLQAIRGQSSSAGKPEDCTLCQRADKARCGGPDEAQASQSCPDGLSNSASRDRVSEDGGAGPRAGRVGAQVGWVSHHGVGVGNECGDEEGGAHGGEVGGHAGRAGACVGGVRDQVGGVEYDGGGGGDQGEGGADDGGGERGHFGGADGGGGGRNKAGGETAQGGHMSEGLSGAVLRAFALEQGLSAFMVPKLWVAQWSPLPKNSSGKVLKAQVVGRVKAAMASAISPTGSKM
jgi:hypothetical protein